MTDFKLRSVNWRDGMLVTQQHLVEQEAYLEELSRWYGARPGDGYGLIRKGADLEPAMTMSCNLSGTRVKVDLTRCQAITPGGRYVEIGSGGPAVSAEADAADAELPVFLVVEPDLKVETGDPDPREDIPRLPYRSMRYSLHLGTAPSVPDSDMLPLSVLQIVDGQVAPFADYFPPCLHLNADERLHQRCTDLRNRLENLLSLASRAYTAITTAGALSEESSSVQVAFKETMFQMACVLSMSLDEFVVGRNGGHPLQVVTLFKRVFRVFGTLLNLHPGLKDYLNARYFVKELNTEASRFLSGVDSFLMSEYDHRNIGKQLKTIDDTLAALRGVFGFLANLKREQLGPQAVTTDTLTYRSKNYRLIEFKGLRVETVGELCYVSLELAATESVSDAVILMAKDTFSIPEWNNMQVRLGINEARGLGETDPVDVDAVTYGDKVALHPQDMLQSPTVGQITLIFRGARDIEKLSGLAGTDLTLYTA